MLLGSTALGLVLIISGIVDLNHPLFLLGNLFILVGGMYVWRGSRTQGTLRRRRIVLGGVVVGFVWLVVMVYWLGGQWSYVLRWESWCVNQVNIEYCSVLAKWRWVQAVWESGGLIIYLTSIYIGRW